ncbi:hypothetical protein ACQ4PT_056232 [Festuca glaucescens]
MALVEVELPPEAFDEDWQPTPGSCLVIRAPGMDTLKVPLAAERGTVDDVSVWEWSGSAYDEAAEAAEWFSTYFGKPTRLVRFKEESEIRPTNPDYAQGYKIASQVPTVNQEDGTLGTEPTETMLTFRSGEKIRPGHKNKQKESVSAKGKGRIVKVGDPVYVLQTYHSSNEVPA